MHTPSVFLLTLSVLALGALGPPPAAGQDRCPVVAERCPPQVEGAFAMRTRTGAASGAASEGGARALAARVATALDAVAQALAERPRREADVRAARGQLRGLLSEDLDALAPGGARASWPTEYGLRVLLVELSEALGEGELAARDARATLERWPYGEARVQLLAAVFFEADRQVVREWQARVAAQGRGRRPPRRGSTPAARALIEAGSQLLCADPARADATAIRYRVARMHYEADRFAEAAGGFVVIALEAPEGEYSEYAANLYLDSLHSMAWRVGEASPACARALDAAVEPLHERYCSTEAAAESHPDVCSVLEQLRQRRRADGG